MNHSRFKISKKHCFNCLTIVIGSYYHGRLPVPERGLDNRPDERWNLSPFCYGRVEQRHVLCISGPEQRQLLRLNGP
jgi:hypothetical protein